MEKVRPHLSIGLVSRYNAVFKFDVSGAGGGSFFLDLKNGNVLIELFSRLN